MNTRLIKLGYTFEPKGDGILVYHQGSQIGGVGTIEAHTEPRNIYGTAELQAMAERLAEEHIARQFQEVGTIIKHASYVLEATKMHVKGGINIGLYSVYPEARNDRSHHRIFNLTASPAELEALVTFWGTPPCNTN